ncbi:ATP-binding protein [Shewanella phaeophyticola]|uniref:histidine kinase n=1 Tax=Shewanella phaeophyticola TaxID=2978345 RepID=A0ABT2NZG2_9GAMM|nr:transporter substrate-binding domain-containing protein [Shewanella sp. KJ10-1]MCT8985770.1 transporter substrate-binding domain-containing protein [Shewanella sp. KJ10-1]
MMNLDRKYCNNMIYLILSVLLFSVQVSAEPKLTLNVHSNTPPFEWRNTQGEESGFNIDLARYITSQLQYDIDIRRQTLAQTLYSVTNEPRQLAVIAVPAGHELNINTALPLLPTFVSAYNRRGEEKINTWEDLKGKTVAIKASSSVDMYLKKFPADFTIIPVVTNEEGFKLLVAGQVDYVVSEFYCSRRMLSIYPSVKTAGKPLLYSQFYLIMSNKDPAFVSAVNEVIKRSYDNGYFDDLLNRWMGFGKEKIELTQTREYFSKGVLITAIVSSIGLLITFYVSIVLRQKTRTLKTELEQRLKAEEEIIRVSSQFHSVLDGLPYGVCLLGNEQQLIWQNNKYPWILNLDVLKQTQSTIHLSHLIQSVFAGESSKSVEFTYKNKYWKLELHLISTEMVALFIEDYTEKVELIKTTELSTRLASLGELSAGIAHEINNPVGLITQSVNLMRDLLDDIRFDFNGSKDSVDPLLTELDYICRSVDEASNRISNIVRDLKSFAQPGFYTEFKPIDLNKVIETALRLTQNTIKRQKLVLQLNEHIPLIKADELQLQLVFVNFIQNACLAMDKPEPILTVSTGIENGDVYAIVSDNGCGMEPKTLARIREPFFTTRRNMGGTGLGLSTNNKILAEHRAQWIIHSHLGTGTEMKIVFRSL